MIKPISSGLYLSHTAVNGIEFDAVDEGVVGGEGNHGFGDLVSLALSLEESLSHRVYLSLCPVYRSGVRGRAVIG